MCTREIFVVIWQGNLTVLSAEKRDASAKSRTRGPYGQLTDKQLAYEVLPLFRIPHTLVYVIASDTRIAQVSRCHIISLSTFLYRILISARRGHTLTKDYTRYLFLICKSQNIESVKILLQGILQDIAKIKCCKNIYSYGIG